MYTPACDAILCGSCVLLCSKEQRADKGLLVNVPFSNWVKISDTLAMHAKLKYHISALQDVDTLRTTIENHNCRLVSNSLQDHLATNKHVLLEIVHAVIY